MGNVYECSPVCQCERCLIKALYKLTIAEREWVDSTVCMTIRADDRLRNIYWDALRAESSRGTTVQEEESDEH